MSDNVDRFGRQHRMVYCGVVYTITVCERDSLHCARWFCGGCSSHSQVEIEGATEKITLVAAERDLQDHHAAHHAIVRHI